MSHLITPRLPLAPTKIQHLQATQMAGIVHHSGSMVGVQVPQISKVPLYEVPMPQMPDHLHKVKGTATHRPMGNVQMELHGKCPFSLVYIG